MEGLYRFGQSWRKASPQGEDQALQKRWVETYPEAFLPRQKHKGPLISQRPFGKQ